MPAGWNLTSGELSRFHIELDKYWAHFNFVFSDACRKRSTYKFGLIKAIIDCLYSAELTARGMELSYEHIFSKFTENYWNLIAKYDICQIRPDGKTNISMIEKLIYEVRDRHAALSVIEFENLNDDDRIALIALVKKECRKNVVGALFQDFNGELYGFDHKEDRIWLHLCAYNFLMTYKIEIEQMNYYAWAKFLDKINQNNPPVRLIEKLELSTPQRKNLSVYRDILRNEFESNNCFYCGSKLETSTHVDHVLPWSFVKSDHLWNFVLACPKCNTKKKDLLPSKQKLAEVTTRNQKMISNRNPFVYKEFVGYSNDLMWKIWDYAHKQGYRVFDTV